MISNSTLPVHIKLRNPKKSANLVKKCGNMFEFFTKVKYVQPACRLDDAIVFSIKTEKPPFSAVFLNHLVRVTGLEPAAS